MELFVADQIIKQYGSQVVLDRVDLTVCEGTVYGLLGPNGAGKTTLIRIINQITAPDSGSLYFKGKKLCREDIYSIGYLPEERGLYKKMEVGEQALYLARLKGMSRRDALASLKYWFEKFEIQPWWSKKVEELSKGMQQKVQFITTILHKPDLLIFDEPFSGFDPINAELMKNEIMHLNEEGATVIFSTHNMASVEELCEHISLINRSRVILQGSVREIRREFKSGKFEISFSGNRDKAEQILLGRGCSLISQHSSGEEHSMVLTLPSEFSGNELLSALIPNFNVLSFREVMPGMNDVFIRSVRESGEVLSQNDLL